MRTTVWIPDKLYRLAKERKLNISRLLREALMRELGVSEEELLEDPPEVVVRVRCPRCGNTFLTSSLKYTTCRYCGSKFSVVPKRKVSRIVEVVKGSREDIIRMRSRME